MKAHISFFANLSAAFIASVLAEPSGVLAVVASWIVCFFLSAFQAFYFVAILLLSHFASGFAWWQSIGIAALAVLAFHAIRMIEKSAFGPSVSDRN